MTKEEVLQIFELQESSATTVDLLPIESIQAELDSLAHALARLWPNYSRVTLDELDIQPAVVKSPGRSQLWAAIRHKTSGRAIQGGSDVMDWAGPRDDYWVITAELAGLK